MDLLTVFSVAAAHASTNLDEIPIIFALLPVIGVARAAGSYFVAQTIVIAAAYLTGNVAAQFAEAYAHWLGFVPIGLGLHALWQRWRGIDDDDAPALKPASFALTVLMFLGIGSDSFALMTAIFADSQPAFDLAALAGALMSVSTITLSGVLFAHIAGRVTKAVSLLQTIGPFILIAVGIYVLSDTATDIT